MTQAVLPKADDQLLTRARAILRQGYVDAYGAGWVDADERAEFEDWDDEASAYADQAVEFQESFLIGLLGALAVGLLSRAQLDARMDAYAATANPAYERGFSGGVQAQGMVLQVRWESEGDDTVCQLCADRDGMTWGDDEGYPFPGEGGFGEYCLPEGQLVSSPAIAKGYRRPYNGEVVRLVAARAMTDTLDGGDAKGLIEMTVTPNHPILTNRGWVAAKLLQPSDYVVSGAFRQDVLLTDADVQQVPAPIEQIHRALSLRFPTDRHPGRRVEFHGDGIEDAEVEVVATGRLLLDRGYAADDQPLCEEAFAGTDVCACGLSLARSLSHASFALMTTTPRGVGSLSQRSALGGRPALVQRELGRTLVTEDDPHGAETAGDGAPSDPTITRQLTDGLAVEVSFAQIVEIDHGYYTGHVYNLQTSTGWYLAGQDSTSTQQILVSNCEGAFNCRCSLVYEMVPVAVAAIAKYDPDQPRDEQGQWTETGAEEGPSVAAVVSAARLWSESSDWIRDGVARGQPNEQARVLMYALAGEEHDAPTLGRGLALPPEIAAAWAERASGPPGATIDLNLASWTSDRDIAEGFAFDSVYGDQVPVLLTLESGSQSLDLSRMLEDNYQSEWLTGGRFRLVDAESLESPVFGQPEGYHITLRQTETLANTPEAQVAR